MWVLIIIMIFTSGLIIVTIGSIVWYMMWLRKKYRLILSIGSSRHYISKIGI